MEARWVQINHSQKLHRNRPIKIDPTNSKGRYQLARLLTLLTVMLCTATLSLLSPSSASAQVYTDDPPHPMATDRNGVDMLSATPSVKSLTVSVGPSKGGLSFSRTWRGAGPAWNDITQTSIDVNYKVLNLAENYSPATVNVGMATDQFPPPPITWQNSPCSAVSLQSMLGTGGTLAYNCSTLMWTYTAHDGTIYTINPAISSYENFLVHFRPNAFGSLVSIQKPDGEIITYHYVNNVVQSITNNRGYQIKFVYNTTYVRVMTQVIAINNAVDYCSPTAATCAGFTGTYGNIGPSGTAWPTVTYQYTNLGNDYQNQIFSSETDALGNVTTYSGNGNYPPLTVTTPAGLVTSYTDSHSYVPDTNSTIGVSSAAAAVVVNGETWTYAYTCNQQSVLESTGGKTVGYYCSSATVVRTDPATNKYTVSSILYFCWTTICNNVSSPAVVEPVSGPFLIVKTTDELSRVTNYEVDNYGRVFNVKAPLGNVSVFTYDAPTSTTTRGNLITVTNEPVPGSSLANIVYSATYPTTCTYPVSCNEPTTKTDADGNVTSYTYNNTTGQVLTKTPPTDINGNQPQTRLAYTGIPTYALNSSNSLVQVGTISELTSTSECASGTAPSCVGTSAELLTNESYSGNSNGLLTSKTEGAGTGSWALNLTTSYTYSPQGDVGTIVDPRGNQHDLAYDVLRRKVAEGYLTGTGYPWLSYSAYAYDADSDLTYEYRATGFNNSNQATGSQTWQTTYTPTHKVKTKVDPLGETTTYAYDSLDRLSTVTDPTQPTGRVTQYVYDAASQKTQEQRAVGTSIQENYDTFTYSQNGKVLTETDARGNAITYAYDGFDRLSTTTYADGSTETNAYDPDGEMTIWTNRAGLAQTRCYDALGRRISEKSVTGATNSGSCPTGGTENRTNYWYDFYDRSFTYDLANRMTAANSANGWNRAYTYDAASRPLTMTDNFGATFTYGHDAAGNLVSIQYPTGHVVGYVYDDLDRMTSATLDGHTVATLTWDPLSRRTSLTYGDTSSVSYGYDNADRMNALSHVFPNGTSANVSYTFAYGDDVRLTARTTSNSAYNYTASVVPQTYATATNLNQYPTVNGATRSYTGTGAEFQDGTLSRYYDQANAMSFTQTNSGSEWTEYQTDALGRVISNTNNNPNASPGYPSGVASIIYYSYGPERPETILDRTYTAAYNSSPSTYVGDRIYVLGPNPDERLAFEDINGTVYYPHTDRQGSTIALSTAGASVLTLTYDAYGQPSQSINELGPGASSYPYLYTGQRYDPFLQAYDYKARIYSAVDGRFWQPDGIGPKDDIDLYSYTHNSPLNGTDPSGNCTGSILSNADGTCLNGGYTDDLRGDMEGIAARQAAVGDVMDFVNSSTDGANLSEDDVARLLDVSWKFDPGAFKQYLKEHYFPNATDKQLDKIQGWFVSAALNPFNPNGRALVALNGGGKEKTITDAQLKAVNNILDSHKSDADAQAAKSAISDAIKRGDLKIEN